MTHEVRFESYWEHQLVCNDCGKTFDIKKKNDLRQRSFTHDCLTSSTTKVIAKDYHKSKGRNKCQHKYSHSGQCCLEWSGPPFLQSRKRHIPTSKIPSTGHTGRRSFLPSLEIVNHSLQHFQSVNEQLPELEANKSPSPLVIEYGNYTVYDLGSKNDCDVTTSLQLDTPVVEQKSEQSDDACNLQFPSILASIKEVLKCDDEVGLVISQNIAKIEENKWDCVEEELTSYMFKRSFVMRNSRSPNLPLLALVIAWIYASHCNWNWCCRTLEIINKNQSWKVSEDITEIQYNLQNIVNKKLAK